MKEDPHPIPRLLLFLLTGSFATLATFAAILGGALSLWLQEHLSKSQILGMALGLAGILLVAIWTGVIAASRQRAKISKLEAKIQELMIENSSYRNPPPISDADQINETDENILMALTEKKRLTTVALSNAIGIGIDATELRLAELKSKKLIHLQMMIDSPSYWYLGMIGKQYLVNRNLIQ